MKKLGLFRFEARRRCGLRVDEGAVMAWLSDIPYSLWDITQFFAVRQRPWV